MGKKKHGIPEWMTFKCVLSGDDSSDSDTLGHFAPPHNVLMLYTMFLICIITSALSVSWHSLVLTQPLFTFRALEATAGKLTFPVIWFIDEKVKAHVFLHRISPFSLIHIWISKKKVLHYNAKVVLKSKNSHMWFQRIWSEWNWPDFCLLPVINGWNLHMNGKMFLILQMNASFQSADLIFHCVWSLEMHYLCAVTFSFPAPCWRGWFVGWKCWSFFDHSCLTFNTFMTQWNCRLNT